MIIALIALLILVTAAGGLGLNGRGARRRTTTVEAATSPRVLVVSGSYGAGHDSAAREIRLRLEQAGWPVTVADVADLYRARLGGLLRRAYFFQLDVAPRSWGRLLTFLASEGPAARVIDLLCGIVGAAPARGVRRLVTPGTVAVVSTHPFASQALGRLRTRGDLTCPAVTYLTDASVHRLWVHRGIDLHLALHQEAARQARACGAGEVLLVDPLTPLAPRLDHDTTPLAGLARPYAVVVGGSEGVGELTETARDLRDTGLVTPVVVCGHNETLRAALSAEPGVVAIGWTDALAGLIDGSACVVQNAGGFTSLEAIALGTPVISYRCLPGHGSTNAAALEVEGLVPWPRTVADLAGSVSEALAGSATSTFDHRGRTPLVEALGLPARTTSELVA